MNVGKLAANAITLCLAFVAISVVVIAVAPSVGWRVDTVLSGSMEPSIATGGIVVIGPVSAADVRVGDVISFTANNVNVCHRVIAIKEGTPRQFTTKGDANDSPDPLPVSQANLRGKVALSIPLIGRLIVFMKTPVGLFMTVIIPLLALIGIELFNLITDKNSG